MPIDPVTGSIIVAGIAAGGQGANAWAQGRMNKKTRKWNEKMYNLQRTHALADWQQQADYNSPENQMKRLKQAGLNPHLIYGNGADAQMNTGVRQSSVEAWNPQPAQFDLGSVAQQGLGSYFDIQSRQASIDNLEKQGVLLDTENLVKHANIQEIMSRIPKHQVDTETGKFNLDFKKQTLQLAVEQLQANLKKTGADTQFTIDENIRKEAMQKPNLRIAAETIFNMQLQQAKTQAETELIKQHKINMEQAYRLGTYDELNAPNMRPSDPGVWKMFMRIMQITHPGSSGNENIKTDQGKAAGAAIKSNRYDKRGKKLY